MTWGRRESKGESKEIRCKVVIQERDDGGSSQAEHRGDKRMEW